MKLTTLIVDDDLVALSVHKAYIESFSKKYRVQTTIHTFSDITEEFHVFIAKQKIDLAILDIKINQTSGIAVAKKIQSLYPLTAIIFISNYAQYTFDAFELLAYGYLMKTVKQETFERLFVRTIHYLNSKKSNTSTSTLEFIYNRQKTVIKQHSICYIQKDDQRVNIITNISNFTVYESIKQLESRLCYFFIKAHSGLIINMNNILHIDGKRIIMNTGDIFDIPPSRMKKVNEVYKNFPKGLF
ncbi:LytR/AlgR family response regulator transcription factor [Anaeromicropila populeti]|uniref:Stage 0 sporulation protein A homolog n=1 Tax=Anaeromicropila populeti TaxID=37658 RepID=A0A1I6LDB3_9FIRM|nr:LytTR family DNA-binding domain-containing protein [Anaeromicropila populeti]SFS01414.1 two component transcriptional regulator, LytTR family [Anaeromicropila populeti]